MSASKLAERELAKQWIRERAKTDDRVNGLFNTLGKVMYLQELLSAFSDEMALRVFEDTRERAARQVTPYRSANAIRRAIRAMQPEDKT